MRHRFIAVLAAAALAMPSPAAVQDVARSGAAPDQAQAQQPPTLHRFASAAEFEAYVEALRVRREQERERLRQVQQEPPPAPAQTSGASVVSDEEFSLSGSVAVEQVINTLPQVFPTNPEITNNQSVGVDEGGIVKQIGHFLIVLQDGRLFSVDLGAGEGGPLRLADRLNVYRSRDAAASWYDEMLVHEDRILVTAYNYEEDASEISVFRLDGSGRITREGRFLISSNDYYSTENYATRIVGDNLILYAPVADWAEARGRAFAWPRLRRAALGGDPDEGRALIGPTDVYAPVGEVEDPVLHTLSVCPLRGEMDCRTTAFIGPAMREVYVSPTDAFLWIGAPDGLPWSIDYGNVRRRECPSDEAADLPGESSALLYRMPLDGSAVGAVAVEGTPENQFAFDSRGGRFRALLAQPDENCRKWETPPELALLDIPLDAFGAELRRAPAAAYTPLPAIESGELENRFVGDWLIYGGRTSWSGLDDEDDTARPPSGSTLFAVPLARPAAPRRLRIPHNAVRIERAGSDAVVTGYRGDEGLSISYVALGASPHLTSTTLLAGRYESEGRSHAFGAAIGRDGSGLIALPTSAPARSGRGWSDSQSSELSFIAVSPAHSLLPAGQLRPLAGVRRNNYRCEVSCVDWYGNSRPIFTGGRIFALMGTDLVEGRVAGGRIGEAGRVDLTAPVPRARR